MPLEIVRNDITKMSVDAIVNAAKNSLLGGGGVDGCIHRAAGPELLEECRALGGCATGEAKITAAYRLPCRYVIHTVGPVWQGGTAGERELLAACYRNSLALAKEYGCETVAFPLISAGVFGYPKDRALRVATESIAEFLMENDMTVYLVMFGASSMEVGRKLFPHIAEYIDDQYTSPFEEQMRRRMQAGFWSEPAPFADAGAWGEDKGFAAGDAEAVCAAPTAASGGFRATKRSRALEELLRKRDESFSEMLLRKIDERGMTDSACYKKANIDRKLFSKIRNDRLYKPKKTTALAFAIALELNLDETRELLEKAGYALSRSSKFDIIVEYFIRHGNYNIYELNEALFAFDQSLLGA